MNHNMCFVHTCRQLMMSTSAAHALAGLKVEGQQPAVQVYRLWRESVGETGQGVMGVVVLGSHLFVVLSGTNYVLEYEASTGRLQQQHTVEGLRTPIDMAGSTAHQQLVICEWEPYVLYLVDVVQGEKLVLTTVG